MEPGVGNPGAQEGHSPGALGPPFRDRVGGLADPASTGHAHTIRAAARVNGVSAMIDVLFTVDVEIWCERWDSLDEQFPDAFKRYVYGPTRSGDHALPLKLAMLRDYGLRGVFFPEALFATRFGTGALQELVGLLQAGGQEIQLHLHTEWVDEARPAIFDSQKGKRQFMRDFTLPEQTQLLEIGLSLLRNAGATNICAFRAGSFGMGRDTITAVGKVGLRFDTSYNQSLITPTQNPLPNGYLLQPTRFGDVIEYPASVIRNGSSLRHLQLGACSFEEMKAALWEAHDAGWQSIVILGHNFDLMNQAKNGPDRVLVRRFRKLCEFLDRYRGTFRTTWFNELDDRVADHQPEVLAVGGYPRAVRQAEQAWRRLRYR